MSTPFNIKPSLIVIPMEVFQFDVMAIFGEYDDRMEKKVKPRVRKDYRLDIRKRLKGTYNGRTVQCPNGAVIIHFRMDPTPGGVAHEVFHAVDFLMRFIGNPLSDTNDETYAYLTGYITDQLYEHMSNHRKNHKK